MSENISVLINRLGYDFKDRSLVELALSHRSVGAKNNERLEFLGDSIVNFLMAEALFLKFPSAREGELSQMRSQLVKGVTLADIAREFGVGDFLHLGQGELKSGGHRRSSILADAVEALIGAIYIDGGMEACKEHVLRWYQSRLDNISNSDSHKDAKTQLQELLQSRHKELPVYHLLETVGSDHQREFSVECEVGYLRKRFTGSGKNRRAAEQSAAQDALSWLETAS